MRVPCAERMCSTRYPCRSTPSTHVSYAASSSSSSTATRRTVCCRSAATQCTSPPYRTASPPPPPLAPTSWRERAVAGGSLRLTQEKPPMACSSTASDGSSSSPRGARMRRLPTATDRDGTWVWRLPPPPKTSGRSMPRGGRPKSEIGRSVATCSTTRGGGQFGATPPPVSPSISAGLRTYPRPPLSSKRAWCSCEGRSLVCRLSAAIWAPAAQHGSGSKLSLFVRVPLG
mmetsp:Transcript_13691/g.40180  ORF Transcript_13691/g.40180 Transcript_13691/m.40180 type:complete len:230 (+) Transcript_13691:413-1102(+)